MQTALFTTLFGAYTVAINYFEFSVKRQNVAILIFTILISIIIGILIKIFTCLTRKFRYTIFYLFVT